jgi:hypothetical protein
MTYSQLKSLPNVLIENVSGQLVSLFAIIFKKMGDDSARQASYLTKISELIPAVYKDITNQALIIYFKRACSLSLVVEAAIYFRAMYHPAGRDATNAMTCKLFILFTNVKSYTSNLRIKWRNFVSINVDQIYCCSC